MTSRASTPAGMPEHEPVFSISVVARLVGVHQQTIRLYERAGLVEPARTPGQTRRYSPADVERLRQIVRLVGDLGVNLAGAQVILRLLEQIEDLRGELAQVREELEALRMRAHERSTQT